MIFQIKVTLKEILKFVDGEAKRRRNGETNLVRPVGGLPPRQAEERWHLSGREGGAGRRDPAVVGREAGQGGLAHAQRRRHGPADVQRLVERQPAQAVGVEAVGREEGLVAQQRWLWGGGGQQGRESAAIKKEIR